MKLETRIWTGVLAVGVLALVLRMLIAVRPVGVVYSQAVQTIEARDGTVWTIKREVPHSQAGQAGAALDVSRTIGLWIAVILTLSVFSFLYRDNVCYKLAESVVVGVSAAYAMVVGFWEVIIPNLVGKLHPAFVQRHISPEYQGTRNLVYLVPLILGLMLLWRLAPKGAWIARWPLAFIIGLTAGFRLIAYLQSDFVAQIQATVIPLVVLQDGGFQFWHSVRNIAIVGGVLACLTYFFFSVEHKGVVGKVSRVGIWILMITFGASFAYTVMGRITLLTQRFEFLFNDWLWLRP